MNLPRSLAEWAPLLSIFPRETGLALGPVIQRLARLLGPFRAEPKGITGEPNGFDGFTRRGSYERLILSEWLLAEEAPLEFARRAATGEHAFIRIARHEPASSRRTLLLFDAGPNQFGGPRIAHLAALILLARRAESAGAGILWGIVQSPEPTLYDQVTPAAVLSLLAARSFAEPSPDALERWHSRLRPDSSDDPWLVGGELLAATAGAGRWSRLLISDTYEPGAGRLHVTMIRRGSANPSHEAVLDLPEQGTAARLLRDPFKATPAPSLPAGTSHRPASNILFVGSSKMVARSAEGGIIVYTVPNSPREKASRPRLLARNPAYPIIAAARMKRQIVIVSRYNDRTLRVEVAGGGESALHGNYSCDFDLPAMHSDDPVALRPCWYYKRRSGWHSLLLHLEDGTLLRLSREPNARMIAARDVIDLFPAETAYWQMRISPKKWLEVARTDEFAPALDIPVPEGARLLLGQPGKLYNGEHPIVAIESLGKWSLPKYQEEMIVPPEDATPVGVLGCRERSILPAIVVLQGNRRTVSLIGTAMNIDLVKESSEIESIVLSPLAPELAYTTSRELVVYSIARAETLMRIGFHEEDTP